MFPGGSEVVGEHENTSSNQQINSSDVSVTVDASTDSLHTNNNNGSDEAPTIDPYKLFDDISEDEHDILTFRALFVGCLFGALVNASNIYLGLKAGWTTSANLFGSIGGFAILKACSQRFPQSSLLGGKFGPQENNIVQTAATAAGGLSSVFVSALPAMYQLGLLRTPPQDFFRILTLTATGGYFGLLFAAPLRNFFITKVARDLNLIFPSSSAVAVTIRNMHLASEGSDSAWKTMRALGIAFFLAFGLRIVSQYATGIFWDWHIFTWMVSGGILTNTAIAFESWGWFVEVTPAFIGSGMLVGMNVALSFTAGSIIAWGIIGPWLVSQNMAFGTPVSTSDPKWDGLMSYLSLANEFASADHPSPRFWLLWPGVACMVAVGLTELALQWRMFWALGRGLYNAILDFASEFWKKGYRYESIPSQQPTQDKTDHQIEFWMWLPGLTIIIFLTCLVTKLQYDMSVLETLLALFLAVVLSLTAIQATGATDVAPLATVSKATQIVLGATTRNTSATRQMAQRLNLLGGALAANGANQSIDLIGDFRVGFLLRTPPGIQFLAQSIGTAFACFIAPSVFVMFATAYPCILSAANDDNCPFTAPAVQSWRAVAIAATENDLPIPPSSIKFSIFMAALGVVFILVKQCLWVGSWEGARRYHPNLMIAALAFTLPAPQFAVAVLVGALFARIWKMRGSQSFETYGYSIAAGLMAGEGVGGSINAIMAVMGIGGDKWGTTIGCPAGRC